MKNLIKSIITVLLAFVFTACRHDVPEDIHDHEDLSRIVFTVKDMETGALQTLTYQTGSGADRTLKLQQGRSYETALRFYGVHNDVVEDITDEIITEKDEHFVEYEFAGTSIEVQRTADDIERTDRKRLGLKTVWKVNAAPVNALVRIAVIHGAASVDDTARAGGGTHQGGETDAEVKFNIE